MKNELSPISPPYLCPSTKCFFVCFGGLFVLLQVLPLFFVHSDDVALESAPLESWTGKNNPIKKKELQTFILIRPACWTYLLSRCVVNAVGERKGAGMSSPWSRRSSDCTCVTPFCSLLTVRCLKGIDLYFTILPLTIKSISTGQGW